MKMIRLVCCLGLLTSSHVSTASSQTAEPDTAPDRLEVLRSQFIELKQDALSGLSKFDDRYADELDKLGEAAKAKGDLELVLAVKKEADSFRERGSAPFPVSPHPELARLQGIYKGQLEGLLGKAEEKQATLIEGYKKQLEALRVEMTQEGNIEGALAVREEERSLEKKTEIPPETPQAELVELDDLAKIMVAHRWKRADRKGASVELRFDENGSVKAPRGGTSWAHWRTSGKSLFVRATGPEMEFKLVSRRPPHVLEPITAEIAHLKLLAIEE